MTDAPPWFNNALADGLTMLVALSLPGTPPAETIALTLQAWVGALWTRKKWREEEDLKRLHRGFVELAGTCTRWPSPQQLVDALPPREPPVPQLPAPDLEPEQLAARRAQIDALIAGLSVDVQAELRRIKRARAARLADKLPPKE